MEKMKERYIAKGRCSCGSVYSVRGREEILVGEYLDEWIARHPSECSAPPSATIVLRTTDTEPSSIFDQTECKHPFVVKLNS